MKRLVDLNDKEYMVVDLDTGTVLGTNLVVVVVPDEDAHPGLMEDIISNDSVAWGYATDLGSPLFVED